MSLAAALLALTAACGAEGGPALVAEDVWARAAVVGPAPAAPPDTAARGGAHNGAHGGMAAAGGVNSAVYLVLENRRAAPDRLMGVRTDAARAAEIHLSQVDERGVMRMRQVEGGLEIPARGEVALRPGGYHIMLIGLAHTLEPGERVPLTLSFEHGGELSVEAEVRAQ